MRKTASKFRFFSIITVFSMLLSMMPNQVLANTDESTYTEYNVEELDNDTEMEDPTWIQPEEQEVPPTETVEEEPVVQEEESKEEEQSRMSAFKQDVLFEEGKVTVTISAAEGVLPEGATAQITELNYEEDVQDILDTVLVEDGCGSIDASMYDVVLYDKDGNPIQPNGKVTVTITGAEMDILEEYQDLIQYKAVRVNEDETLTVLKEQVDMTQTSVSFENDHFTAVGVVAYADEEAINAAKDADTLQYVKGNYIGYSGYSKGLTYINPLYVYDEGKAYIAYCFNAYKDFPGEINAGNNAYVGKYVDATDAEFNSLSYTKVANKRDNVLKTVYYGYPYNAGGIQQKYGLSAMQFRAVTQAAIWLYTDNEALGTGGPNATRFEWDLNNGWPYSGAMFNLTYRVERVAGSATKVYVHKEFDWTANMTSAYNELINNGGYSYPSNFELDLYAADKQGYDQPDYQNLLSVKLTEQDQPVLETKIDVKVEKRWDDGNDQDKLRPTSVTVTLYEDGVKTNQTKTLNEQNGWSATFSDLTKSKNGKDIQYTVKEDAVAGYTESISGSQETGYVITNKHTPNPKVTISKTDITGTKEIAGAQLKVVKGNSKDGKDVVETWTSVANQSKEVTLEPGTYTLVETTAPNGYEVAEAITFTVNQNGTVTVKGQTVNGPLTMKDDYSNQKVIISKTDITGTKEIAGAELKVVKGNSKDGTEVVKTWTSKEDQSEEVTLKPGTYTLVETTAPNGYKVAEAITFIVSLDNNGKLVVKVNNQTVDKVVMKDEYKEQEVEISKVNVGGEEIEGAKLSITDEKGKEVTSWESVKDTSKKVSLQPGTYTLTETTAPKGYEKAESIKFSVDKEGNVKVYNEQTKQFENVDKVTMEDAYSDQSVEISKVNVGGEEIEGAKLSITDEKGKEVVSWESEKGTSKKVSLQPGTYTLTETTAPKGYEKAESIKFSVDQDGNVKVYNEQTKQFEEVDKVTMEDAYSDQTVTISKTDITGTKEIAGAELKVVKGTSKDGTDVVKTWTSKENQSEKVTLKPGTYTLVETTAPNGYEKAEAITFTVSLDKDGNQVVKVNNKTVDKVVMKDAYSDQSVEISKVNVGGEEIEGAKLSITDENGNEVASWESEEGTSKKVSLQPGTYTLTETTAPKGYEKAESIKFSVDKEGNVKVYNEQTKQFEEVDKVTMEDAYSDQSVEISKVNVGGEEIEGAKLSITDEKGKEVVSWESEEGTSKKVSLQPGTYTLTETTAPKGYEKAESIKFSVDKEGNVKVYNEQTKQFEEVDKVTMEDAYSDQKVIISKTDITGTKEIAGAELKVVKGTSKDGTDVVKTWTSKEGQSEEVTLKPGTYTLVETTAPNGYEKAEAITFTVSLDKDGNQIVTVGNDEVDKVVMKDDYSNQKVIISKTDITGTKEIEGAKLKVVKGDSKDGTEVVKTWTSKEGQSEEVTLKPGTYTLVETTAPNGYEKAEAITFTVSLDKDGNQVVKVGNDEVDKVVMKDDYSDQTVTISKTDITGTKEIAGAELKVVKGDSKDGTDVVKTWTSKEGQSEEVTLKPGTYTLVETTAPKGYKVAEAITFTVSLDKDGNQVVKVGNDEVDKVVMKDDYSDQTVTISKTDITGTKEIAGAELKVVKGDSKDGTEVVKTWTSKEGQSEEVTLKPGTYTLVETTAPNGYEKAEAITFTVSLDKDGNQVVKVGNDEVDKVVMKDDYSDQNVEISKVGIGGKEIAGAKITVSGKDASGKTITPIEWTSEADKTHTITVQPGTYTFHEEIAPDGYLAVTDITFSVNEKGEVKVIDANGNTVKVDDDGKLVVTDQLTSISVSKVDITSSEELEGAHIQILDEDGNVVKEWNSTTSSHRVVGLTTGKVYILHETVAPDGYTIAADTKFMIKEDGTIDADETTTTVKDGVLLVEDTITKVKVSKVDINGGEELEGAQIQILDEKGKVVEEWTSTKDAHEVTGLTVGKTYTLRETVAPDGYSVTSDTTFVLDEKGKVDTTKTTTTVKDGTLLVEDTITKVKVSKVDINDGEELEGAQIQILDEKGKVVEEWTSTKDAHEVTGLTVGKTYTLRETVAPDGYSVTSDTTFVLDEKGEVDTTKTTTTVKDGVLLVEDKVTEVKISKVDITNGKELEGAVIQILDKDGKVVEKWVSTKEVHVVKGLKTGQTYTLREKVAPKGYEITADTTFELNADGTINTSKTTTKVKDGILLVEDSKTPTPGTPTGSDNGMKFYGSLFTVSMAGAAWMLALRKKRED